MTASARSVPLFDVALLEPGNSTVRRARMVMTVSRPLELDDTLGFVRPAN